MWDLRAFGDLLASCGLDGRVVVTRVQRKQRQQRDFHPLYEVTNSSETSAAVDLDLDHLLTGGDSGTVSVWDASDGRLLRVLEPGHGEGVTAVRLRGDRAASGGCDRAVRLWNVPNGECLAAFKVCTLFLKKIGDLNFFGEGGGNCIERPPLTCFVHSKRCCSDGSRQSHVSYNFFFWPNTQSFQSGFSHSSGFLALLE